MIEPSDIDDETKEIVIESTKLLFPHVTDVACFREVFESFNWDLEKSINALKTLFVSPTSDTDTSVSSEQEVSSNSGLRQSLVTSTTTPNPSVPNFSSVLKTEPKQAPQKMSKSAKKERLLLAYEEAIRLKNPIQRIAKYTEEGIRVMIIMRGCPGSGKTTFVDQFATSLCRQFCSDEINSVDHHILGADDFWIFPQTGKYIFNAQYLEYAHLWNQKLVQQVAIEGRSPLFIDNTHTRMWEMKAVVTIAIEHGYIIEILEPPNEWIFNDNELVRRNVHGVHKEPIRKMLARYEHGIKPTLIMSKYGLSYQPNLRPPQRHVVTFDHPPSKNHLKIFNNRFYSAPSLDVIFALKSNQEPGGVTWKTAPKLTSQDEASGGYGSPPFRMAHQEEANKSIHPLCDNILSDGLIQPLVPKSICPSTSSNSCVAPNDKPPLSLTPLRLNSFQEPSNIPSSSSEGSLNSLQDENVSSPIISSSSAERTPSPETFNGDHNQTTIQTVLSNNSCASQSLKKTLNTNTEFVLVQPTGDLLFHKHHIGSPATLSEFVSSSSLRKNQLSEGLEELLNQNQNMNVQDTWQQPGQPETIPSSHRSVSHPSQKKYEFWTNTNYEDFDVLNKVNGGHCVDVSCQILVGRLNAFKGAECSYPPVGTVQMIATHDKSSMTSTESVTIVDTSMGIALLQQMYPTLPVDSLAELFEKCHNNLDDTVGLLIDSGLVLSSDFVVNDIVQIEAQHEPEGDQFIEIIEGAAGTSSDLAEAGNVSKVKKKKVKLTEEYSDLIKKLTSSIKLNDDHYSDNLKKVRHTKSGKQRYSVNELAEPDALQSLSDDDEPSDSADEEEEAVEVAISSKLFSQLQDKFGRVPNLFNKELNVKLPVSLARQLYSYSLDALYQQLENQQDDINLLIKEDEEFARQLQGESSQSPSTKGVSLQDIMDHEMALKAHEKQRLNSNETTIASKLSQRLLIERFPKLDPTTLSMIMEDTNNSLEEATNLLKLAGHEPKYDLVPVSELQNEYKMSRNECILQANAYHEVAEKLNDIKTCYFTKAKKFHNSGNFAVAAFYSELFNWYSERIKESNSMAARAMLLGNKGATTIDLHFLRVAEAIRVLDLFLDDTIRGLSKRKQEIFIITGRGLHSTHGVSKIKPAVKMRLKKRGLTFSEVNEGMIKTKITKTSVLSFAIR